MPSKNSLKIYIENSFYHIYNRGVEKRVVFQDGQDYKVFLTYLKEILSPPNPQELKTIVNLRGQSFEAVKRPLKNYYQKVDLVAYCLIPNHFHFLIKQIELNSMEGFMRSLMTRYCMYFNKKYNRVGSLFQGRYKAKLVDNEAYLLHLSRYIHLNSSEYAKDLTNAYSSYADYLGLRNTKWIRSKDILYFFNQKVLPDFKKVNSYKSFVEKYEIDSSTLLGDLILE